LEEEWAEEGEMPKKREVKISSDLVNFTMDKIMPFYEETFSKKALKPEEARAIDLKHKIATEIMNRVIPKRSDRKSEPIEKPKPIQVDLNESSEDISTQTPEKSS